MDDKKLRLINQVSDDVKNTTIQKLQNVLPDVFTENVNVEYRFNWYGKKKLIKSPHVPTVATLKSNLNRSKNFDDINDLYIEGDKSEALKILQKSYSDKVTLIYVDSPYNTDKDFIHKDNFEESLDNYLEPTDQVDRDVNNFSVNNGQYHTDWLDMMYPELKLARNLLTEEGTIFISVDGPELDTLKKIADEIFGGKNFLAQVIWEKVYLPVNLKKNNFSKSHDYILVYGKKASIVKSYGLNQLVNAQSLIMTRAGMGVKRPMIYRGSQLLKRVFVKSLHIR